MAYISIAKLEHIRFMCHKILPLVYDESLSYYEVLCKVAFKLNESIEAVNNLNDNVTDLNSRCNTMQEEIEAIANEINTFESEVESRFNALEISLNNKVDRAIADMEQEVTARIAELEQEVEEFKTYVDTQYAQFEARVNTLIREQLALIDTRFANLKDELQGYIYVELQKIIAEIPEITTVTVISPITGELTDIQTMIYQLYDAFRIYALTVDEFDSLGMTCEELDHIEVEGIPRGLTAYEWDFFAKQLIGQGKKGFVENYLTGELVPLQVNVDINNSMLKESGSYECSEFDSVGGTCSSIDGLGISALTWDWQSNNYYVA